MPWSLVLALNRHPGNPRIRRLQEETQHMGRNTGHKGDGETRGGQTPRVRQGPVCRPRAATGRRTTRDTAEYAGMRHGAQSKRRRLEGDGCGRRPGGGRSAPGKDVGSG